MVKKKTVNDGFEDAFNGEGMSLITSSGSTVDARSLESKAGRPKKSPGKRLAETIDKGYWKRLRRVPKVQKIRRDEDLPRVMKKKRRLYFSR